MKPFISLHHISKIFKEGDRAVHSLEHIDLDIRAGEFFVFVGPSGSGKSTLLRIMSGLEKDFSGTVAYDNEADAHSRGFVFQQFALFPWLTVYQNIELGLLARHVPERERKEAVHRELKEFGLETFAHTHPRDLSGGMRQRVGIARALATDPRVLFMDEPFSELDMFTAEELHKNVLEIWQKRKMTIVMVTHIIEEAVKLADRIAVLTPRPGKIEKVFLNTLPRPRVERSQAFYDLEDQIAEIIKP